MNETDTLLARFQETNLLPQRNIIFRPQGISGGAKSESYKTVFSVCSTKEMGSQSARLEEYKYRDIEKEL